MAIAKDKALVRLANKADTDLTGKEGYIAEYDAGLKLSGGANALGVITEGGAENSDIAVLGPFDGIVRMKAGAAIQVGQKLAVHTDGTVKPAPSAGTMTIVGVALQDGAKDELIEVAPYQPNTITK